MTSITSRWRITDTMSTDRPKVEAQRVSHSAEKRILQLSGALDSILEFDALLGKVYYRGERVLPLVSLPRTFIWAAWEFSLPELGPAHRFRIDAEVVLGMILAFRLLLQGVPIYEDRDLGRTILLGSQLPLSDYPLPIDGSVQSADNLPVTVENATGSEAVEP